MFLNVVSGVLVILAVVIAFSDGMVKQAATLGVIGIIILLAAEVIRTYLIVRAEDKANL